ncbi:glyoxal oxidase N-terminus-domain-containing protein [Dipodascopsis tothii]|uniref:glyoxal oxidase N-terminus-domain-containing protein n=1 Tax=Dipodascopsis tothii TaxID=44089 RepID=UPI0034CE20C6
MKLSTVSGIVASLALVGGVSALKLPKVQVPCDAARGDLACPRGMACGSSGWCEPSVNLEYEEPTSYVASFGKAHKWGLVHEQDDDGSSSSQPDYGSFNFTTDGSCGASHGYTVCGDWEGGPCCSAYGVCGSSYSACGPGCQSGTCFTGSRPRFYSQPLASNETTEPGTFDIVGRSGVPAMHAGLLPNGKVFFLDKLENYTEVRLPNGQYAYSTEYDPETNTYTPLAYKTNAFCSGGAFLANGAVVSLGGNDNITYVDPTITQGFDGIRYLKRSWDDSSYDGQDWSEPGNKLNTRRWYASAQTLGNGEVFVISGSLNGKDLTVPANNNPTYEILDQTGHSWSGSITLDLLVDNQPYYLYPFVHLMRDGLLFIFTSRSSILYNIYSHSVIKTLPDLAGDFRTYPSTGSSVLLPLTYENSWAADIIVCGGGAYQGISSPTDDSCGRIQPESANPTWEMDYMTTGRVMVEGMLLPDGKVMWLNGGHVGSQGFNVSREPVLEALLYDPEANLGERFTALASSTIPRLYHSVSLLLQDGRVMVAGSNPITMPILVADQYTPYVTEFRVEVYTPPYLSGDNAAKRPTGVTSSLRSIHTGDTFTVTFTSPVSLGANDKVKVLIYHGGYVTHSLHMGQRMIYLEYSGLRHAHAGATQTVTAKMPPKKNISICPPGPYLLFVTVNGIPSVGVTVMINEQVF